MGDIDSQYFRTPDSIEKVSCDRLCINTHDIVDKMTTGMKIMHY